MAVSPDALLQQAWRGIMRSWSRDREHTTLSKDSLMAAFRTTDAWIDQNAASFNNSLPAAAKAGLSPFQKTILFCVVAMARSGGADYLRRFLGEVD